MPIPERAVSEFHRDDEIAPGLPGAERQQQIGMTQDLENIERALFDHPSGTAALARLTVGVLGTRQQLTQQFVLIIEVK